MAANLSCLTGSSFRFRRVLNSFVQPSHSGVPPLLHSRVMPYYVCLSGFALLCHFIESTPVIQHQLNSWRTFYCYSVLFYLLRCFRPYDVFSEPLLIEVTSCPQNHIKYPYSLTCNCYLCLHAPKRPALPVPVIQEHIQKCPVPVD